MEPYFRERFGNPHSADHVFGWRAAEAVEGAALRIATMLGADADEIVFTSGATEANNLAMLGLARAAAGGDRNRVLVGAAEHKSVLALARVLRDQLGYEVETIPVGADGVADVGALEAMIDERVLFVSVMLVNNEIGSVNPVREIGRVCESRGVLLHCDGAQAPVAADLGAVSDSADLLSLSAHKMYGPMGAGVLFVRRSVRGRIHPVMHGGGQQGHLRSGTLPVPLCVGTGAAAEIISGAGMENERARLRRLRDRFVSGLRALDWPIHLNGPDLAARHPGNANMRFEGFSAHDILGLLQPGLAASTGSACTTGSPESSHVLAAIGLTRAEADASIRFSLGRQTSSEDVEEAVVLIGRALADLSGSGLSAAV
ncbi:MAG: cysteine desulfurase [Pirellulales bacterium]|nr:cysteine desulfurase [Pirellulales bacterium]